MKKLLLFLVFSFVLVSSAYAESLESLGLRVDFLKYSPSPIQPGDEFTAFFKVTNIENFQMSNIRFDFSSAFPIESAEKNPSAIPDLFPGKNFEFKHKFKVSEFSGSTGQIQFSFIRNNIDVYYTNFFNVTIESLSKDISFDSIVLDPERLSPGKEGKIKVLIKNSAYVTLNDVEVLLNVTSPFIPSRTTNERRIQTLLAGQSSEISFDIIVDPEASLGTYMLPLQITYYDPSEKLFRKDRKIGIVVYSSPEYELSLEDSDTMERGTSPEVTLSISNTGTSDIKFLSIELLKSDFYNVISNKKVYVGNLEPDDFETAGFKVYLEKCQFNFYNCNSNIPLKIRLSYKDSFNENVYEVKEINVRTYSKAEAKKFGLSTTSSNLNTPLIIIILIVLVVLFVQEYRKTKNIALSIKGALKTLSVSVIRFIYNILRSLRWSYIRRIPRKIRLFFIRL